MLRLTALAIAISFALLSTAHADFVQPLPGNITSSHGSTINTPAVLVGGAMSISDPQPSPKSGGGGTSWWVDVNVNAVQPSLTFNFPNGFNFDMMHLWDYYTHTPDGFTVRLYDGVNATGSTLHTQSFSITPSASGPAQSVRHDITFSSGRVYGAKSVRLTATQDLSTSFGGFGLAEIGFTGIPEPTSVAMFGLAMFGFGFYRRRKI